MNLTAERTWTEKDRLEGSEVVRRLTGILVPEYRWPVVHSELERLGDRLGVRGGLNRVILGDQVAQSAVFTAAGIPETYLFRHNGHFKILRQIAEKRRQEGLATTVLCAGCSTGEEVWSAAAVLAAVDVPQTQNHRVIGWDLSPERIGVAQSGIYSNWSYRKGFAGYDRFFERDGNRISVTPELRVLVFFQKLNLVSDAFPSDFRFDVIFFRNVSIYWEQETVNRVCDGLAKLVAPGGAIFVGPSDPVELPRERWEQRIEYSVRGYWHAVQERVKPKRSFIPESPAQSKTDRPERPRRIERHRNHVLVSKPNPKPLGQKVQPSTPQREELGLDQDQAFLIKIRLMADAGKYQEALEELRKSKTGATVEGKLWRGILLLATEREEEAVSTLRQCVFLSPGVTEYRRWLAIAYESVGRTTDAEREYRNAGGEKL